MIRLLYLSLACLLATVPFALVWAAERPPTAGGSTVHHTSRPGFSYMYWGGGRGGWLGGSYRTGHGSYDDHVGGSGSYRGGGPSGGGK